MKSILVAVASSAILLGVGSLAGQTKPPDQWSPAETEAFIKQQKLEVLRDLPGVFLRDVSWQGSGPSEENERLRIAVELRLRNNGIRLLTNEEIGNTPGFPLLLCYINYYRVGSALIARTGVTLKEDVVSVRTSKTLTMSTWENSVPRQKLVDGAKFEEAREWLLEAVDEFCNAYRAANPKAVP